MNKRLFTLSLVFFAALTACSSKPVQKQTGNINFVYQPISSMANTDKIIAIVTPSYKSKGAFSNSSIQQSNNHQILNPLLLAHQQRMSRGNVNFSRMLHNYVPRLTTSMGNTFNEIIISKGFTISGPYETFDDITYGDKKTSYLALVPDLNLYIDKKSTQNQCNATSSYCEDYGTIQVGGFLNIKLIEPLTKQTFLSKRINLSELTAQRDYVKRAEFKSSSTNLVDMAFKSMTSTKKPLIDNTDKALVDALNEFYSKAMKKVDDYISTEEVMSFEKDVMAIKRLKRF